MGQQQLILIMLGVIIVGIAIAVGIGLFQGTSVNANKNAIINDLMNIGQYANRYRLRPEPLGGGGRTYNGFNLPQNLRSNENADYTNYVVTPQSITFTAVSKFGYGNIIVTLDSTGNLGNFSFTGDFE